MDVRVVCATNQNPEDLIKGTRFARTSTTASAKLRLTSRHSASGRKVASFSRAPCCRSTARSRGAPSTVSVEDAVKAIESYSWPGNVRELENKIKGAVIMADGKLVTAADLGIDSGDGEPETLNLREVRQHAESKAIRVALTSSYGNISKAAELLGITRPTLYDLMHKYGLSAEAYSKRSVANAE